MAGEKKLNRHTEFEYKLIDEYFNLTNSEFPTIKSLFFFVVVVCLFFFFLWIYFNIKHTIESEQRIQLLTKYQQIQGEGEWQKCTIENCFPV